MRLFEVSLVRKVSRSADATHYVSCSVVLASGEADALAVSMEGRKPDDAVAAKVVDLGGARAIDVHGYGMPVEDVRALLDAPGGWTVLSRDLVATPAPTLDRFARARG